MNGNEFYVEKEYNFDNPLDFDIDSIIDNCCRDCHNKCFRTFEKKWLLGIQLTNIGNNEVVNLPIADKSMNLYELNKEMKNTRQNDLKIDQIKKTIKTYSNLSDKLIH